MDLTMAHLIGWKLRSVGLNWQELAKTSEMDMKRADTLLQLWPSSCQSPEPWHLPPSFENFVSSYSQDIKTIL